MAPVAKKVAVKVATKTTTSKKATSKKVEILIQRPGSLPEKFNVEQGTNLEGLVKILNLDGYVFSVNGSEVSKTHIFTKGDVVRIGVKTKQG